MSEPMARFVAGVIIVLAVIGALVVADGLVQRIVQLLQSLGIG